MADVKAESLTKIFGPRTNEVNAVNSLDIEIRDGEFVAFVGPSGSGKTTFLRLVAGLEVATSGRIYIGGQDVTTHHPRARRVAMVFQDYALYPHMTVQENLSFALRNLKYPRKEIEARVQQVAAMLQIDMLLGRKPRELSGGQRQRVAVGRAIVRNPEVYLFDEPLSNLDAKLRTQMRVELAQLHHQLQTTTIYVTHDQVEAMTLGERIVLMNDGVIQQVGTAKEIYDEPHSVFVAGFVGAPPMNILDGELTRNGSGQLCAQVGERQLTLPNGFATSYGEQLDKPVILGLRPEHIDLSADNDPTATAVQVSVRPTVVEMLGEYILAYFDFGGTLLTAKLDPDVDCRVNQTVELNFNLEKMHLFDPATGRVIPRKDGTQPA